MCWNLVFFTPPLPPPPQDWLHYLLAGCNFPHAVSHVALLPQNSSKTAADALLHIDDARALAACEEMMQRWGWWWGLVHLDDACSLQHDGLMMQRCVCCVGGTVWGGDNYCLPARPC